MTKHYFYPRSLLAAALALSIFVGPIVPVAEAASGESQIAVIAAQLHSVQAMLQNLLAQLGLLSGVSKQTAQVSSALGSSLLCPPRCFRQWRGLDKRVGFSLKHQLGLR